MTHNIYILKTKAMFLLYNTLHYWYIFLFYIYASNFPCKKYNGKNKSDNMEFYENDIKNDCE